MLDDLKERITALLARVELAEERPMPEPLASPYIHESHPAPGSAYGAATAELGWDDSAVMVGGPRGADEGTEAPRPAMVGRNAACPCGSGKKFKHCHGMAG